MFSCLESWERYVDTKSAHGDTRHILAPQLYKFESVGATQVSAAVPTRRREVTPRDRKRRRGGGHDHRTAGESFPASSDGR
ncbi:hypothetical protein E2C01_064010 [Portunus trituberculatus]|uniref:Uncharacterized protein n=1 Tax=Portunus trituberculatus TaxID=210409 RepID=A0A5B7HJ71_PORTR|nr:hypothetical protein [Portunus trituberculatus]